MRSFIATVLLLGTLSACVVDQPSVTMTGPDSVVRGVVFHGVGITVAHGTGARIENVSIDGLIKSDAVAFQ